MKGPVAQILDELSRRIAGMLRMGLIEEVDYAHTEDGVPRPRLRVRSGELITGWLPWPAHLGRNRVDWMPLKKDQQVLLAAPSGDVTQAVVIALLHVDGDPPPSTDETADVVRFRSGSTVRHDADTGDLFVDGVSDVIVTGARNIEATASGKAEVTAPSIVLNGPVQVNGNVGVAGTVAATGDVTAGSISGQGHTHPDPQGGNTGAAQ